MSNKYQEALSKLEAIICELSCELKEDYELYTRDTGYEEHIETLQELVDKETPMKAIIYDEKDEIVYKCPDCGSEVRSIQKWALDDYPYHLDSGEPNRCDYCGKRIDWSDDND